ncbi:MAG TPA: MBL fold metallo-hydrolase [Chitinophagales bacterium]|nr:MBL fold metallo-hydrolase [Chitinophagales bacterium]
MRTLPYFWLLILFFLLTSFNRKSIKINYREIEEGDIINLYDAFGKDTTLKKDFGFSCITKYHGKIILFDAGSNAAIFKYNTTKLGIDLKKVDLVIISHGHFDHLNGLDYLLQQNPKVKIYFPYDIFWGAPVPFDATGQEPQIKDSLPEYMQYFNGSNTKFTINQSGRFWNANIEFVKASAEILPGLNLIATNSAYLGYFSCYPNKSYVDGQFEQKGDACKNTNLPELSLSMKVDKGQVVIVGCSHTGIENIIQQAKTFTKDKIELVYGGFHLLPFDRMQTVQLINILKNDLQIHRVAPAHCTGHLAFRLLKNIYADDYLYAGLGETISFK